MDNQSKDQRPELNRSISAQDFRAFYWLKAELIDFCRSEGLSRQGGKIEIADRIERYLITGKKDDQNNARQKKPVSKFDWANAELTRETPITDNYKNSENVRRFFKREIGPHFKFNVKFMNWMKDNIGQTLGDAVNAWHTIGSEAKNRSQPKEIAPQFEYNTYIRDFLADNPDKTKNEAVICWNVKRKRRATIAMIGPISPF